MLSLFKKLRSFFNSKHGGAIESTLDNYSLRTGDAFASMGRLRSLLLFYRGSLLDEPLKNQSELCAMALSSSRSMVSHKINDFRLGPGSNPRKIGGNYLVQPKMDR